MTCHWLAPDMTMRAADYCALLEAALSFKRRYPIHTEAVLHGRTIYFLFHNASLRTRSSFQTGLSRMGGHAVVLDPRHGIYTPALPDAEIPYATDVRRCHRDSHVRRARRMGIRRGASSSRGVRAVERRAAHQYGMRSISSMSGAGGCDDDARSAGRTPGPTAMH